MVHHISGVAGGGSPARICRFVSVISASRFSSSSTRLAKSAGPSFMNGMHGTLNLNGFISPPA